MLSTHYSSGRTDGASSRNTRSTRTTNPPDPEPGVQELEWSEDSYHPAAQALPAPSVLLNSATRVAVPMVLGRGAGPVAEALEVAGVGGGGSGDGDGGAVPLCRDHGSSGGDGVCGLLGNAAAAAVVAGGRARVCSCSAVGDAAGCRLCVAAPSQPSSNPNQAGSGQTSTSASSSPSFWWMAAGQVSHSSHSPHMSAQTSSVRTGSRATYSRMRRASSGFGHDTSEGLGLELLSTAGPVAESTGDGDGAAANGNPAGAGAAAAAGSAAAAAAAVAAAEADAARNSRPSAVPQRMSAGEVSGSPGPRERPDSLRLGSLRIGSMGRWSGTDSRSGSGLMSRVSGEAWGKSAFRFRFGCNRVRWGRYAVCGVWGAWGRQ